VHMQTPIGSKKDMVYIAVRTIYIQVLKRLAGSLCQLWKLLDCYGTSQQYIAFAFQHVHVTYMQVCITRNMSPSNIYRTGSAELRYSADIKKHEKQAVFEPSLHAQQRCTISC